MIKRYRGGVNILCIVIVIIILSLFFIWQNNHIIITEHIYKNKKVPYEFNNFKIIQISDLHNKSFGKNQKHLLKKLNDISPDIIIITGDLIDRRRYDLETALLFIDGAKDIGPIYYVSGNHEAWSGEYDNIRNKLIELGVIVLDDKKVELVKDNKNIEILGLKDPAFFTPSYLNELNTKDLEENLKSMRNDNMFQILLSHRPELMDIYAKENMDMVFSGHAHGGQFRIPIVGGLFAPGQGFIPKYTSGSHTIKDSKIYISRGLGNSLIPIRIFNRPELVVVRLFN